MTIPTLRVAVDWDNDLFVCYDSLPTDALNIIPAPLHHSSIGTLIHSSATSVTQTAEFTPYGVLRYRVVSGTNTQAGMRFGDDGVAVDDIPVNASATYRWRIWVRGVSGSYGSVPMTARVTDQAAMALGDTSFTLTADWTPVTVNVTTAVGTTHIRIIVRKDTDATNITYDVTGFMLVAGTSAPTGFNVGDASNGYDVITADVRSADWTIGKHKWNDIMPAEGVATLVVNNDDRKYSPEYTLSPLYGAMEQKRMVTIDVWKPSNSTWVRKYSGWARRYLPAYGKNHDNTCEIHCEQGIFRLREIRYRKSVTGAATADSVIAAALFDGYVFTTTPLQSILNNALLNASYFVNPDDVMTLDTGVSEINLSGEAWGDKDNVAKVIEELMRVEQGWFFIQGDGLIRFYNRHHYIDPALTPATVAFAIDNEAVNGSYRHSENYHNVIQLTHYPFTLLEGETLWTLREDVGMIGRQRKEVEVRFEREEGARIEVAEVNRFDGSADASTYIAVNKAGAVKTADVHVEFSLTDGRSGTLSFKNTVGSSRRVSFLELKGTARVSYGGQTSEAVSEQGVESGAYILSENTKLIDTEVEAENLAHYLLGLYDHAVGEFHNIQLISRNTTVLEKALDNGLGAKISVSEHQTNHSGEYVIVGEQHGWSSTDAFRSTLVLDPLFRRPDVWICGQSALGVDTYLAY